MQRPLAALAVAFGRLLLNEPLDVRVAAVRVEAAGRYERVDAGRGIPVRGARHVHQRPQLLLAELVEIGGALEDAHAGADADGGEVVRDGFGLLGEPGVGPQLGLEPARVSGLGQKLPRLRRVVWIRRSRPREFEVARDDAARHPREAEGQRLVDGLAVDGVVDGQSHAPVGPR